MNELTVGTRRVGDFIDFDPSTPEVKVILERSEQGINITLSWTDREDSPYARWFLAHTDIWDNSQTSETPQVPRRVLFHDSYGSVLLIHCWTNGFHAGLMGPGRGTLSARAAIMGAHRDVEYDRPHGLQTEISGLRSWLGVTSWDEQYDTSTGTLIARLTSLPSSTIEVGPHQGLSLSFQPRWMVTREQDGDRHVALDQLYCLTRTDEARGWDEHLQLHRAVRDLLVISRWHAESCVEVFALRVDDPLRTLDGVEHGDQWREVVVPDDERKPSPTDHQKSHLIRYAELGAEGVRRWLMLRDSFARALDPVISSIELRGTTANTLLAHTAPGLEALGYLLMLRDGLTEAGAARASLQARFDRILQDLDDCLPFDGAEWASRTIAAYNGLKHANRRAPELIDVANAWRRSVLVARAWVASELGVPFDDLKERLAHDPLGSLLVPRV